MLGCLLAALPVLAAGAFKTYKSKYYEIQTDLAAEDVREASLRMTAMAELYHDRTKSFAGTITHRFPFRLFSKARDYYEAGGLAGSGGVYDPNTRTLMAIAGSPVSEATWYIIRHEGFHQFAHNVIGGMLPAWVNEGLAEYFAESIFTGDGYVTGVIRPARLERVQLWIREGHTLSIQNMMNMPHELWNDAISVVNYDQAWTMVYFLAHGQNGKYERAFNGFLREIGGGRAWEQAWANQFGRGVQEFERQWHKYWDGLPENPTADLYDRATVETLTSFFARAFAQKQRFATAEDFFAAAKAGKLKQHAEDWLPAGLLKRELERYEAVGAWEIRKRVGFELVCRTPGGVEYAGQFQIQGARVKPGSVKVRVK